MARFESEKVSIWRGVIDRQQGSGVSAMRFCRKESIPYWKFNYWKKRLPKIDGFVDQPSLQDDHEFENEGSSEE
jgi:hypothetical protein